MELLASSSTASLSPHFAISSIYKNHNCIAKVATLQVLSVSLSINPISLLSIAFRFILLLWICRVNVGEITWLCGLVSAFDCNYEFQAWLSWSLLLLELGPIWLTCLIAIYSMLVKGIGNSVYPEKYCCLNVNIFNCSQ